MLTCAAKFTPGDRMMRTVFFLIMLMSLSTPINLQNKAGSSSSLPSNPPSKTQVVLLGTGTPNADPDRSGPAVAVVVNDTPYVIDCGPGVVRRAAAAERRGVRGLAVAKLRRLFITHLHSDHTVGLPDLDRKSTRLNSSHLGIS